MSASWTLVTGASGFIGGELVRQLLAQGEHVKAFVRPGSNLKYLRGLPPERFQLAYGDITVSHTVYRALAGCSTLYHVASNFRMWAPRPEQVLQPAVEGTRATLEAAWKRDLTKVVVTSSIAALGRSSAAESMDERHEFNLPDAELYIRSKYEAEQVAHEFAAQGLPLVIVNPSTVFGPGDWKPTPSGESLLRYLANPPGLRVPITRGGINAVDVEDVARGHILAMQRGRVGERYILGGENLSFEQLFLTLSELTGLAAPGGLQSAATAALLGRLLELKSRVWGGKDPIITYRLARDYADSFAWVSSAKAEAELGYTHRPARETLERAVRWFLANGYVSPRASQRVRLELRPHT